VTTGETRRFSVALARGLVKRCPRCGQSRLFRSWFKMLDRCPRCGLRFEQDEGSRLGSAMVNYAVVAGVLVAYIVIGLVLTFPDPPIWPLVGFGCVLIVLVAVAFFPFAKTIWSAMELGMKSFDVGDRPSSQDGSGSAP
jgi:uncharacterized protein (DUF983 family)